MSAENKFLELNFVIPLPDRRSDEASEASWEINFQEEFLVGGQNFCLSEPLCVSARANWIENGLLAVSLGLRTKICGSCVRCLDEAALAISDELLYLYSSCGQEEDRDEMIVQIKVFGKTLNVVEQVWESLVLILPSRLLCSENCKGLCPSCGADLN